MRFLPVALAAFGCALALPAAANAAYDLGVHPDGVLEGTSTTCATGCTIVQDWNANEQLRVPGWLADQGVVVRWRVRGGGGQARLQRVALDGARTASALSATEPVQLTGTLQELPAALPVRAGDALGLALTAGARVDSVDLGLGESTLSWAPALDAAARAGSETAGTTIAFQAVIEPDVDADGLGDETQDACVNCGGEILPPPPPDATPTPAPPAPTDPYAEIRTAGPKATIAPTATKKGKKVAITVTNPHAFALSGDLKLKRGKKVVAKAMLKLAANATRTVSLKVSRPASSLTAAVTLRGPVGKARTTTAKIKLGKPASPSPARTGSTAPTRARARGPTG